MWWHKEEHQHIISFNKYNHIVQPQQPLAIIHHPHHLLKLQPTLPLHLTQQNHYLSAIDVGLSLYMRDAADFGADIDKVQAEEV